ncbi:TIGR03085 family metal-binding protein [Mariniluteicoccus endophyticus]
MTTRLRDAAYRRLIASFEAVDAGAPTLCEGWTAHHLAAHVWGIKHSWRVAAVMATPVLDERSELERVMARHPYDEVVAALAVEDGRVALMPTDALEGHRHALGEFYVHGEDVRRANGIDPAPVDTELADALALRVAIAGRQLNAFSRERLVLQRPDGREAVISRGCRGATTTVVVGEPGELLLWVHGRRAAADVTVTHH